MDPNRRVRAQPLGGGGFGNACLLGGDFSRCLLTILRGYWWWWGPPIVIIAAIFLGLFLTSVGFDKFANPRLAKRA